MPKLRFPEFQDARAWPTKPLSALAKRQSKRNSDHEIVRVLTNSAEHGVVDQRDYFEKDIATQGNLDTYFIVKLGDYVYNPRISNAAPVGPISKNKVGDGVMSPLYTVFRFSSADDSFYEYYFRSSYWHGYMRHASNSGARHDRMAITNDDFMQMPLPAPDEAEQQKIADCLSSLDAVIAAEGDRLAALKDHKKGLIQQLFPAPGQTTPHRRFPEFQGKGEWESKPLSSFFTSLDAGVSVNSSDRPASLAEKGILKTSCLNNDIFNASENKVVTEAKELSRLKEPVLSDTIIISRMNTPALVGANAYVAKSCANIFLPDRLWAAKPRTGTCLQYIAHVLSSESGRKSISDLAMGTSNSMKNIAKSAFLALEITVPEYSEQEKIANCLSSLDRIITAQSEKVDALKTHKAALMQQLFPLPHEVEA